MSEKERTRVSIVKGDSAEAMIRKAVGHLGGMKQFVKQGETVFVKPNMVSEQPPPVTTPPELVAVVVKMCLEAGAGRVMVGDMPAIGEDTTSRKAMTNLGMDSAVKAAGGEVVYLDEEEEAEVDLPAGKILRHIQVPGILLETDCIINMPVIKTHLMTVLTCCIKNWHGVVPDKWKELHHRSDIHHKLVDLFTIIRPRLNIIDGIQAMDGQGPCWGTPQDLGVIIATDDPVAGDAVASAVIGIDPFDVPTTYLGSVRGVGVGDLEQIEILGDSIESVRKLFRRASFEIDGVIEGFEVYEGGMCLEGCKSNIRVALDILNGTGMIEEVRKRGKKFAFVGGKNPVIPPMDEIEADTIVVVGDCAVQGTVHERLLSQRKRTVLVDLGCPPVGWVTIYGKVLEACGLDFEAVY